MFFSDKMFNCKILTPFLILFCYAKRVIWTSLNSLTIPNIFTQVRCKYFNTTLIDMKAVKGNIAITYVIVVYIVKSTKK